MSFSADVLTTVRFTFDLWIPVGDLIPRHQQVFRSNVFFSGVSIPEPDTMVTPHHTTQLRSMRTSESVCVCVCVCVWESRSVGRNYIDIWCFNSNPFKCIQSQFQRGVKWYSLDEPCVWRLVNGPVQNASTKKLLKCIHIFLMVQSYMIETLLPNPSTTTL